MEHVVDVLPRRRGGDLVDVVVDETMIEPARIEALAVLGAGLQAAQQRGRAARQHRVRRPFRALRLRSLLAGPGPDRGELGFAEDAEHRPAEVRQFPEEGAFRRIISIDPMRALQSP